MMPGITKWIKRYTVLAAMLAAAAILSVAPLRAADLVFTFSSSSHDLEGFKPYAELAAGLKDRGRVQIPISALSDKNWASFPPGGCPWREYACYVPAPWMFYPDPKIAPFIDPQYVAANRKLLLERAALVRQLGIEGTFVGKNSHFLPEAFFEKYPQYRGPRVDHPRRSTKEAFSMCLDLPETLEMVRSMMAEIKRNVPEVTSMITGTNDAGAGLCWAAALYPGPNGPEFCKDIDAGQRVRKLSQTIHQGAVAGGGDITLIWGNVNFWQNEEDVVRPLLPENTYLHGPPGRIGLGTRLNDVWPFMGVIDVLGAIQSMERFNPDRSRGISFGYSAMYSRGDDTPQAVGKLIEIATDCMDHPVSGLQERLDRLCEYAGRWGGQANQDRVFQALYDMHEAFQLENAIGGGFGQYSCFYAGVSMRHLTRPMVIKPELLTQDEESYFLPYVFNPNVNEARMDYIDFHGGRMRNLGESWNNPSLNRALAMANRAGRTLQNLKGAPEGDFLRKMGLSLQMWTHEIRSIHNFYYAQQIRDKYKDILAGPKRVPSKASSWDGDPGNLEWNAIMRDEFDNTNELIALLEDGGLEMVARAKTQRYEDTFLLGPDLVGELKKKAAITRAHWLDVQDYLAPPLK